ncbi:hypothetical protein BH18ACI3_BH18ACI3_07260 [soil metagenome]
MNKNTAFKFAPVFSEERKVDVSLREDQAVIRLSTWEGDLGWCGQKTITLDVDMLDELHRVIAAARLKLKRDMIENDKESAETKVLQFPSFRTTGVQSVATG